MNKLTKILFFIFSGLLMLSCSDSKKETVSLVVPFPPVIDSILRVGSEKVNGDSLFKQFNSCKTDTGKISILFRNLNLLPKKEAAILNYNIISISKKHNFESALGKAYLSNLFIFANTVNKDSAEHYHNLLKNIITKTKDTSLIILDQIYYGLYFQRNRVFKTGDSILNMAINMFKTYNYDDNYAKAIAYYYLGKSKGMQFDNAEALRNLKIAAKYSELAKTYEISGDIYFRIGEAYIMESDYNSSLHAYGKAVEFAELVKDNQTIASCQGAMGEIYMYKDDKKKAKEFLFKSLTLAKKIKDTYQQAYTSSTIGYFYLQDSNYVNALYYFKESTKIYSTFGRKAHNYEIIRNDLNVAELMFYMGNTDEALKQLFEICSTEEFKEDPGIATQALADMCDIYLKKNDYKKAEEKAKQALKLSIENEFLTTISAIYLNLSKINERNRNFEQAHHYHKAYSNLYDSLTNKSQIKKFAELENEIAQSKLKTNHDKKEADLRKEKIQKEEELKRQRITSLIITIGFVVLLFFAVFVYRSLQDNKRKTKIISQQKKEVEYQKEIIEEKKKEVMDSIAYAKKIQEAILPSNSNIKKIFPESFVIYKPKDVVAGDFYWLDESEESILVAAADCTGHGVPGAMVSVVCSNALNRAVKEFKLKDPGLILDKVREIVIDTFEKSGSEVKDGMDISLACIEKKGNGESTNILWAGANNPLWYISEKELIEIKADKQPVGKFVNHKPFTTRSLNLKRGDILYLITDGFADQFGGPKGKKFKYRNLKDLLVQNACSSLNQQQEVLTSNFDSWKSNLEQVDDVTIIGIRL